MSLRSSQSWHRNREQSSTLKKQYLLPSGTTYFNCRRRVARPINLFRWTFQSRSSFIKANKADFASITFQFKSLGLMSLEIGALAFWNATMSMVHEMSCNFWFIFDYIKFTLSCDIHKIACIPDSILYFNLVDYFSLLEQSCKKWLSCFMQLR